VHAEIAVGVELVAVAEDAYFRAPRHDDAPVAVLELRDLSNELFGHWTSLGFSPADFWDDPLATPSRIRRA
jgi:hypothetical protein